MQAPNCYFGLVVSAMSSYSVVICKYKLILHYHITIIRDFHLVTFLSGALKPSPLSEAVAAAVLPGAWMLCLSEFTDDAMLSGACLSPLARTFPGERKFCCSYHDLPLLPGWHSVLPLWQQEPLAVPTIDALLDWYIQFAGLKLLCLPELIQRLTLFCTIL
jgi:hypothetical protein